MILTMNRALILLLVLLAVNPCAFAQFARTAIFQNVTPAQPVAGEPFLVNVSQGPCESLDQDPQSATAITLPDGTIRLFVPALIDINCTGAVASRQYLAAGFLAPGERRLEVYIQSLTPGEPADPIGLQILTVVAAAAPRVVPMLGNLGLAGFVVALTLIGLSGHRPRGARRSPRG
jgi:hypothetical protein